MDDLDKNESTELTESPDKSPSPPSTRSERIGLSEKKRAKKGFARLFTLKWLVLVVSTTFLLIFGMCVAVALSTKTYSIDDIHKIDLSTVMYASDQKTVVGKVGSENREYLTYNQIVKLNPDLPKAFVKVEDRRFWKHKGVDFHALGRAIWRNLAAMGNVEGASTITMQVAGGVVLKDRSKTYTRKLREMIAALSVEREATKEELLEIYMNYNDFGNGAFGVQSASKVYFGKDLTKQTLEPHEMALLAGLLKAPYGYNPYGTPKQQKKGLERRNVALMLMAEKNETPPLITEAQKIEYQKKPLGVDVKYRDKFLKTRHFAAYKDFVQKELKDRYGLSYQDLNNGGYKVYTSMDAHAQGVVDRAMKNPDLFRVGSRADKVNAGITLMNPHNGQVIAIGGGRNFTPGAYNWALQRKQPGSAIKPLTVYGPVIQFKGYNEYTPVMDEPVNYNGWRPQNYTKGKFYGVIPLKEALYRSLNAATAKLLVEEVTVSRSYQFATEQLELPLSPNDKVPAALSLGGLTEGVSTQNMAQAYSAFANNGEMTKAHAVLKVIDSEGREQTPLNGKEINASGNPKSVFSSQTAWYMTRILQEVVENGAGTGHRARIRDGRPVAAKSGTNQNAACGWLVGYTPDLVGAVMVFNEPGGRAQILGGITPAKLFSHVMSEVLAGTPIRNFERPAGVSDPVIPFMLKEPEVTVAYDPATNAVHVQWRGQGGRVKYEVLRSTDRQTWISLGYLTAGSTGYSDTSVEYPDPLGGGKTYYYKVVAIDTKLQMQKESRVVQVVIKGSSPNNGGPGAPPGGGNQQQPPPGDGGNVPSPGPPQVGAGNYQGGHY